MDRDQLVSFLDDYLACEECRDVALNGLQVEGRREIRRLACGVSASLRLFKEAIAWRADAVLVHHGLLWQGPVQAVKGSFGQRLRLLLQEDLSLLAYHLPLDRHPEVGNAAVFARKLGLEQLEPFGYFDGVAIGWAGVFSRPQTQEGLSQLTETVTGQKPLTFPGGKQPILSVGIVTGSGANAFDEAVETGLDALITGEPEEWVMHRAEEEKLHVLACGHYASERFGVQALGEYLERTFGLEVHFFDLPNPA